VRRVILTSLAAVGALAGIAHADPTSGVDGALFRPSYDTNGIFAVEGARLMAVRDLAFKLLAGYGQSPLNVAVPGIGPAAGDTGKDPILSYVGTLDMAFGMTVTDRVAVGFDVAAYRTATGDGYGIRGRYVANGPMAVKSTGLIALRPLSNIDPSASPDDKASYLGDELAGPLDVHAGLKIALIQDPQMALTAIGSVFLPFGDDEMLLGDHNLVYEPKLAFEWRPDRILQTRVVANAAVRIRNRSVLQGYDTQDATMTEANAKVFLDVGSEAVAGLGFMYEVAPRILLGAEAQAFIPLPDVLDYGNCRLYSGAKCSTLKDADYFADAKHGDFTVLADAGLLIRASTDLTLQLMGGTGQLGARGEAFNVTAGFIWAPQPEGAAGPGRNDKDGDGIPDSADACSDEPEDKDGFQDEDGCPDADNDGDGIPDKDDQCPNDPEDKDGFQDQDGCPDRDNDNDGIPDALDKCPNEQEDKDGFEDDDGCPDQDNDGDGIPDKDDKCPNDAETVNGFEDDDGCPDVRATTGPEERGDRIDLKGQPIVFDRAGKLLPAAKSLLVQVATIIKQRKLTIRVEVHVPLGTKSTNANVIAAQKRRDKQTAQRRADEIKDFLISQGVTTPQVTAVSIGSDRPLGAAAATDPINERIDLIKAQQGGSP
jgi:outer membrane protein OmpA-like peptidoglycan-associated protein